MKELRIGLIGASGRGALADYAHQPENGVKLVAAAEIYPEATQRFRERFEKKFSCVPPVYTDYREMIEKENLDGVFVTSPDFMHCEHACYALEHKVAVYLEKPLAISISDADRILETAWKNRSKLVIGHNMRYMDFTRKMKEIIDRGDIGEVRAVWCRHFVSYGGDAYFRDWHADSKYSNSLLLQKGAHDIDVIHWLAGGYTRRVNGVGNLSVYDKLPRRKPGEERVPGGIATVWSKTQWPPMEQKDMYPTINVNDLNMINLELDNGVLACYLQCHYAPDACRNYTVIGTLGRIENQGDGGPDTKIQVWSQRTDSYCLDGDATYRIHAPVRDHGGADPQIVQSFIDALRDLPFHGASAQAARNSVAAGCCGADAIRQGGMAQDVPQLPEHLRNFDFAHAREF